MEIDVSARVNPQAVVYEFIPAISRLTRKNRLSTSPCKNPTNTMYAIKQSNTGFRDTRNEDRL